MFRRKYATQTYAAQVVQRKKKKISTNCSEQMFGTTFPEKNTAKHVQSYMCTASSQRIHIM